MSEVAKLYEVLIFLIDSRILYLARKNLHLSRTRWRHRYNHYSYHNIWPSKKQRSASVSLIIIPYFQQRVCGITSKDMPNTRFSNPPRTPNIHWNPQQKNLFCSLWLNKNFTLYELRAVSALCRCNRVHALVFSVDAYSDLFDLSQTWLWRHNGFTGLSQFSK